MHALPETGYLRIPQIIGDPKANPPIPAIIPVGKSTWWAGVKSGRYPQPVRTLGERITAWRVEDIRALVVDAVQLELDLDTPEHELRFRSPQTTESNAVCKKIAGRLANPKKGGAE